MPALRSLTIENFRSLEDVEVEFGELNVLVGPNAAGKSNLLAAIGFLGEIARTDLIPAIKRYGGREALLFRGRHADARGIRIVYTGEVTEHSSAKALDVYELSIDWLEATRRSTTERVDLVRREEVLKFKRTSGRGRRITVNGNEFRFDESKRAHAIAERSAALSTLPRLGEAEGGPQVRRIANLFESFYVFDPDVREIRRPAERTLFDLTLARDASNLAPFLLWLSTSDEERFELFVDDMRHIVPGLESIEFEPVGGSTEAVKVVVTERGLRGATDLAYASFGTVRAMAILAMLHDPAPPQLRCVEELDHGLHPYALDRIVERLRDASTRGQIIVATHSPALVNRLRPEELIICERDVETGASRIPAISQDEVREIAEGGESELGLGELWFSGSLGGNP